MQRIIPRLAPFLLVLLLVLGPLLGRFQRSLTMEILTWALFALAFNLVYGYTGMLSFGQAIFFGAGAYAFTLPLVHGIDPLVGLILSLAVGAVFALAVGFIAVRLTGHHFVVTTITICLIIYLIATSASEITGGDEGISFKPPVFNLGVVQVDMANQLANYYLVVLLFAGSYWLLNRLVRSPIGLVLQAIRENDRRVELVGYSARSYKLLAFVVAGGFSGLAGALYSLTFRFANAELFFWTKSGEAVSWALVGGAGTMGGPLLGTALLVWFTDWLGGIMRTYLIVVGLIIVLVARQAPEGIVGLAGRWLRPREERTP